MIISAESEQLSGLYLMEKKLKTFIILDEGRMVEFDDRQTNQKVKKAEFRVKLPDTAGTEKKWRPNRKSQKSLIKLFGEETKNYINKKIKTILVPFEDKYSIQIDELDTEELNKSGKGSTLL